ncbi:hypothetical protein [Pseudomonas sp. S2_E02]|jgi:hypothetical protein
MEIYTWILQKLGSAILYTGIITTFTYFLFKLFTKQWIETQFKTKLDNLKHQHNIELQRLKIEIDSLLSGSLKIQEKEFIVLPEIWGKLDEAHGRAQLVLSPMQQYADLERMAEAELKEFLEGRDLRTYDKNRLQEEPSKNKLYQEIIFRKNIGTAKSANSELSKYLARNGIFLPDNIKSVCKEIEIAIWGALTSKEIGREANDRKMEMDGWRELEDKVTPLFKVVEDHIRLRLLSHAKPQISATR